MNTTTMHHPVPTPNTSISRATMRPQDLIPVFLTAVREYCPDEYAALVSGPFGAVPAYVHDEGDSCAWWYSDDATDLLEILFELLMQVAPEGCYFGAHPGDGSDFGWWEVNNEY